MLIHSFIHTYNAISNVQWKLSNLPDTGRQILWTDTVFEYSVKQIERVQMEMKIRVRFTVKQIERVQMEMKIRVQSTVKLYYTSVRLDIFYWTSLKLKLE